MIPATCHPDRKHCAKGLCQQCYGRMPRKTLAWSCPHTDSTHCARGLCKPCYRKAFPARVKLASKCEHTHKPAKAFGMCESCYAVRGRRTRATACPHTDRPVHAKGFCAQCFRLHHKYKLSGGDLALVLNQIECHICGTPFEFAHDKHVDHDHSTGAIRGVLCGGCNRGLGCFVDNPSRMRSAADYIERHNNG